MNRTVELPIILPPIAPGDTYDGSRVVSVTRDWIKLIQTLELED